MSINDGGQRNLQTGWAMARGEGAGADAASLRGRHGRRDLFLGTVMVLALVALLYWVVLRDGGSTPHAARALVVNLADDKVVADFVPPRGCWKATDESSVTVLDDTLVLDLQIEKSAGGCATGAVFPLPPGAERLDDGARGQVACPDEARNCLDPITATVIRATVVPAG